MDRFLGKNISIDVTLPVSQFPVKWRLVVYSCRQTYGRSGIELKSVLQSGTDQ